MWTHRDGASWLQGGGRACKEAPGSWAPPVRQGRGGCAGPPPHCPASQTQPSPGHNTVVAPRPEPEAGDRLLLGPVEKAWLHPCPTWAAQGWVGRTGCPDPPATVKAKVSPGEPWPPEGGCPRMLGGEAEQRRGHTLAGLCPCSGLHGEGVGVGPTWGSPGGGPQFCRVQPAGVWGAPHGQAARWEPTPGQQRPAPSALPAGQHGHTGVVPLPPSQNSPDACGCCGSGATWVSSSPPPPTGQPQLRSRKQTASPTFPAAHTGLSPCRL